VGDKISRERADGARPSPPSLGKKTRLDLHAEVRRFAVRDGG
jgi:hypothetical protein